MSTEETTIAIDKLLQHLRNISLLAFVIISATSIGVLWFENTLDPKINFVEYGAAKLVFSILTGLLPPLLIAVLIEPIYEGLIKLKAGAVKDRALDEYSSIVKGEVTGLRSHIDKSYNLIYGIYENPTPVKKFYSSFYDIKWDELLTNAKSIDLCVFYWSNEWMQQNLPFFKSALSRDVEVNLYLPNPAKYNNEFAIQPNRQESIRAGILNTIFSFMSISEKHRLSVFLVPNAINYMLARISYESGTDFMYSPFMNNQDSHIGRPPVVLLDEGRADQKLVNYINGEINHLRRGDNIIDFEASKYITWGDDASRVIVSMALQCPAKCKFCYVDSVLDGNERTIEDGMLLGILLAYTLANDPRFKNGVYGTTILLGGLSDPLHRSNTKSTRIFLKTLRDLSFNNIVHIATRFFVNDEDMLDELSQYRNVIINYSITSIDGFLTLGKTQVMNRFSEAKKITSKGIFTAIYIRPVIPKKTLEDMPLIIQNAKESGIKYATVGGLYVDDKISQNLKSYGITIDQGSDARSKFIMDKSNKLRKLQNNEVDQIKKMLRDEGIEVFSSSRDIANRLRNTFPELR